MTVNCKGTLIDLDTPRIMGILNRTPDSFYDGGTLLDERAVLLKAEQLLKEGASFLDVGGYSSRPGADEVSVDEEMHRVVSTTEVLLKNFPDALISVDTFRSAVAKKAIDVGAAMVNDISGGTLDVAMLSTIAELQVPYILMHMRGTPQTMQSLAQYENVTKEVVFELSQRIARARSLGINDIIADPGFGFAKTIEQNFQILKQLEQLSHLDVPLLVGISRKSMIYKSLGNSPDEALNGTTVLNTIALLKGANILRVHDVKEALECVRLLDNFKN